MKFGRAPTMFRTFMIVFNSTFSSLRRFPMLNLVLGVFLGVSQLSGAGGSLPQILHPDFKATAPVKAGKRAELTVSFTALKGYTIDRTLPLTLKLTPVPGVTLSKTDFAASSEDPRAK